MRSILSTLAIALLIPAAASAQAPEAPAEPAPAPAPVETPPPPPPPVDMPPPPPAPVAEVAAPAASGAPSVSWELLVDSYYQYNFTGEDTNSPPSLRAYDVTSNNFSLGYSEVAAQANLDLVTLRIDLGYGHIGWITNASSLGSSGGGAMGPAPSLYGPAFIVQQAYASIKLGDMFTLDAGKFVTTAGAEVIESKSNWNYSRSFLFNGIPFLHTGLRGNLKFSDMVSLQLSVLNGWNNDPDNNEAKTFGASLALAPVAGTNVLLTSYIGKETAGDDYRILADLVVAQAISDVFALNLNFDYYKEGDPNWLGVALMGRYLVSDIFNIALRGEFVKSDKGGYAGLDDTMLYEGTLTLGLPLAKNYEIRLEGRGDFSDKEVFNTGAEMKKNQFTGTVAFLGYLP